MKKHTLNILTVTTLVIALVFSLGVTSFAGTSRSFDGGDTRTIASIGKSFEATSSTKATATVQASSSGFTPYITSKITLQSAPLGSNSFSDVSSKTKTVNNQTYITHTTTFSISASKEYRIKIELTDEVNGSKVTSTTYCNLSR